MCAYKYVVDRRCEITGRFLAQWCVRCGHEGTAWADGEGGVVIRCPHCLRERVRSLREMQGSLPGAVGTLKAVADRDLGRQGLEKHFDLFDVFYCCARYDGLIHRDNARYWIPPGESSSPPYCEPCHAELSEQGSA